MKKLMMTAIAALTLSAASYAQDSTSKKMKQSPSIKNNMQKGDQQPDNVAMKEGRIVVYKNGKETDMSQDIILGDGTIVMMDGTVKTKDGKAIKLNNGESIDKNGVISPTPAAKPPMDQTPPSPVQAAPVTPPNK